MISERIQIGGIPAIIWGSPSTRVFIHVHGKMSRKEYAEDFARIAERYGWQTLSFDLPQHGERAEQPEPCDLDHGVADLNTVADWAFARWQQAGLFACSLGAWFSLNAYRGRPFVRCLFQSPVVDMRWLVQQMLLWNGITEERLEREGEIDTPIDVMRWNDYCYIMAHPVTEWPHPTAILYAGKDSLQPEASVRSFAERFRAEMQIAPDSEHPFMGPDDAPIVAHWAEEQLSRIPESPKQKTDVHLELVRLTSEYKQPFFDMMDEWTADLAKNHGDSSPWVIFRNDYHDFDFYVENLEFKSTEGGFVPDTTLFGYDRGRRIFVGAVNIRHELNERLLHSGGHIGDGIRPSERGKGYGTAMVALALHECKKLGITRVLMCCNKQNNASAKTILHNGGVLENEVAEDGGFTQRYWIEI